MLIKIPHLLLLICLFFIWNIAGVQAQTEQNATPPPNIGNPPPDAIKTESGLITQVISSGTGKRTATANDLVTIHYTGWLASGELLDSSREREQPALFPLENVIPGWRECVTLMTVGEKRRCWIPPNLAYRGERGRPAGLLIFDIELLDFQPSPTIPPSNLVEPPVDAEKLTSGLAYKVLNPGDGVRRPLPNGRVTVHYTGWTTEGKVFDSSVLRGVPATLQLNNVIAGWVEGVQLMVEGQKTRFWIPESLAYPEGGGPAGLLIFDIELIRIDR